MAASYKEPPPDDDELDALFKTFDRQLHEVQRKFSDLEKDITAIRNTQAAAAQDDNPSGEDPEPEKPDNKPA